MLLLFFLKGIVVGIVIAVPVGPVGVMCVRRTVIEGKLAGFVSGLGAATLLLGGWVGWLVWWFSLRFGIGLWLRSFEPRHLAWINLGSGAVLVLSGVALLASLISRYFS